MRTSQSRWIARSIRTVRFLGHYTRLFLLANARVAWEIITPRSGLAPAIIELPLRSQTALEVASIAHLITLTPGTLVLEVRANPPTLWVHTMHAADLDAFRAELTDLEGRMLSALRSEKGMPGDGN